MKQGLCKYDYVEAQTTKKYRVQGFIKEFLISNKMIVMTKYGYEECYQQNVIVLYWQHTSEYLNLKTKFNKERLKKYQTLIP